MDNWTLVSMGLGAFVGGILVSIRSYNRGWNACERWMRSRDGTLESRRTSKYDLES